MKKKGLIISTVVMVVVLIASLTTATYAWFTSNGSATVSDIGFEVKANSDLLIGLSKTNSWNSDVDNSKFVSDGTVFNAPSNSNTRGSWTTTSGGDGLGLSIDTGLQLTDVTQAVYTFAGTNGSNENSWAGYTQTEYKRGTGDDYKQFVESGLNRSNTFLKATGSGSTITAGTLLGANMNGWGADADAVTGDYLDVVFGVKAQKSDVKAFGCLITVKNNQTGNVGLSAALHAVYSTDGTNYHEVDLYGTNTCGQAIANITKPNAAEKSFGTGESQKTYFYDDQKDVTNGDATYFIEMAAVDDFANSLGTADSDIKQLHLIIYLCGPDGDCKSGYNANATITIQFVSINSSTDVKA